MSRYVYVVQVPLELPDRWHDLCRCLLPEQASEVVRVLLAQRDPKLAELRVLSREEGAYV